MVNHDCKIDAHTPTEDGSACSCGYFVKAKEAAPAGAEKELIAELVGALEPFAKFGDALKEFGGTMPQSGAWYTLNTGSGPVVITVEDLKAARAALTKAQGSR